MTRLLTGGAEFGHANADGLVILGSGSVVSTPVHSGSFAYSIPDSSGNYLRAPWIKTANRWFRSRFWMRVTDIHSASNTVAQFIDGTIVLNSVYILPNGALSLNPTYDPVTPPAAVSEPIIPGVWFCLELGCWSNGTTNRIFSVRLNGYEFDITSTAVSPSLLGDSFRVGWPGGGSEGITCYVDDIALNDDTGTNNNSWPSPRGKVVALLANQDVAVGNWNLGLGTTTGNRYESVNNIPPQGVVNNTAGSDPKQVRNTINVIASPAADLDLRFPPYSSKLLLTDSIKLIRSGCLIGVSTNAAQNVQHGLIAGPATSLVTSTTPASAASTYPNFWNRFVGPIVPDPVVSMSDRPVMRIGKRSASTAALMCCLAGVLIEYEPRSQSLFAMVV